MSLITEPVWVLTQVMEVFRESLVYERLVEALLEQVLVEFTL